MSQSHAAKRNRTTWALVAVLVVLLLGIGLVQWQSKPKNTLPIRSADSVSVITITRNDQEPIVLQLKEQWTITSPVNLPANEQRVIPLLTVYTNPDPGYAVQSVDLAATGLNDPEVTVSFDDYEVKIGQVAIDGTRRHALHGERVRFVPDWVLPFLKGGISAIADLTIWGDGLSALKFNTSSNLALNEALLAQAKQLRAQQYVRWPRPEKPVVLDSAKLTATINQTESIWSLHKTDRYVAIQAPDSEYAYIIAVDEVPWLLE